MDSTTLVFSVPVGEDFEEASAYRSDLESRIPWHFRTINVPRVGHRRIPGWTYCIDTVKGYQVQK